MLNFTLIKNKFSRRERRRAQIKGDLRRMGLTLAEVARRLGVTRSMVVMVISGRAVSAPVQTGIETITGKKYFGNGKT